MEICRRTDNNYIYKYVADSFSVCTKFKNYLIHVKQGGGGGSKFKMTQDPEEASLQNMYVLYQASLYWYKTTNM